MANYDGSPHMTDAIASVQNQTLHEIEIIVSDDASTDDIVDIIRKLMANDPRIRLVCSEITAAPPARNKALEILSANGSRSWTTTISFTRKLATLRSSGKGRRRRHHRRRFGRV